MELYCTSQFSTLLTIAQDILHALREQGKTLWRLFLSLSLSVLLLLLISISISFSENEVSVERMWVLYLVLKAMLSNLKVFLRCILKAIWLTDRIGFCGPKFCTTVWCNSGYISGFFSLAVGK
jgi:hypothetical protein